MNDNQDHFDVLRKIKKKPKATQRELAEELGFSLGKLNYCLGALKTKGLIKMKNFEKNPNKFNYIYVLTPRGIAEKTARKSNSSPYLSNISNFTRTIQPLQKYSILLKIQKQLRCHRYRHRIE